jgi:hypothetical protein
MFRMVAPSLGEGQRLPKEVVASEQGEGVGDATALKADMRILCRPRCWQKMTAEGRYKRKATKSGNQER